MRILFLEFLIFFFFVVRSDESKQSTVIIVELLLWLLEGAHSCLLLSGEVSDLILDIFVGKFCVEHFLLLINKLLHIQFPGLFGELDSGACDMHSTLDCTSLILIVWVGTDTFLVSTTVFTFAVSQVISRRNIRLFDSPERGSRSCGVFVPNLLVFELFFGFLLFGFFGLSSDEDLLIVWWFEGWSLIFFLHEGLVHSRHIYSLLN